MYLRPPEVPLRSGRRRPVPMPVYYRFFLYGLVLLMAVGFMGAMAWMKRGAVAEFGAPQDIQAIARNGATKPFADPQGRFTLQIPAHWQQIPPEADTGYDVIFRGPVGAEFRIGVIPAQGERFEALRDRMQRTIQRQGIRLDLANTNFNNYPAVFRSITRSNMKWLAWDFIANGRAHHLMLLVPVAYARQYQVAFRDVLASYDPGHPPAGL